MLSPTIQVQRDVAEILQEYFLPIGMVTRALDHADVHLEHIMEFTRFRALGSLFSMLNQCVRHVLNYNRSKSFSSFET
jgi:dynein heavy chain 1